MPKTIKKMGDFQISGTAISPSQTYVTSSSSNAKTIKYQIVLSDQNILELNDLFDIGLREIGKDFNILELLFSARCQGYQVLDSSLDGMIKDCIGECDHNELLEWKMYS